MLQNQISIYIYITDGIINNYFLVVYEYNIYILKFVGV